MVFSDPKQRPGSTQNGAPLPLSSPFHLHRAGGSRADLTAKRPTFGAGDQAIALLQIVGPHEKLPQLPHRPKLKGTTQHRKR